ncbi:type 1 glutamine amidotransferase domain-containing protein [Pseudoduganella sp. DS3]|uniref:Type 1 glutamine amidotransferase domain-containing protein n=1 Tax=Pseudoduganella guangdongensis TaxID=2692179 RepID=A0A6N9HPE8_9BURK|nr:type 1 glutamine amidotransferase domain-containing protein [Pseudoduganella guangdongensis]MYN05538.1 type 1 glutamine amidotransferase domain-containing protein [Pseudoduganella guangdongensis]
MFKKILRGTAWLAATLLLLAAAGYVYFLSFDLDAQPRANPQARPADIAWLAAPDSPRGRVLAVVSSTAHFPGSARKAGYELTELARAYYVFQSSGFEVDIASPQGGRPPQRIDTDDMGDADYAFLNDPAAQRKLAATARLADVDPARYSAVYFVGGKGAMFDFPGNADIARVAGAVAARGGVLGAVCHGPAALLELRGADGASLVAGRRMTGFTNDEELFLMKDARQRLPFLLEERARELGARFSSAPKYVGHVVVDGKLVTGQNPWSTWATAEEMVRALGATPVARPETGEERSVLALAAYYSKGLAAGRAELRQGQGFDKMLVLMHAVVAGMQGRVADAFQLQRLAKG